MFDAHRPTEMLSIFSYLPKRGEGCRPSWPPQMEKRRRMA